ncbi:unnamed protein product [uncultured virus]|nr:unnamed protein product [uncultured virus]
MWLVGIGIDRSLVMTDQKLMLRYDSIDINGNGIVIHHHEVTQLAI